MCRGAPLGILIYLGMCPVLLVRGWVGSFHVQFLGFHFQVPGLLLVLRRGLLVFRMGLFALCRGVLVGG